MAAQNPTTTGGKHFPPRLKFSPNAKKSRDPDVFFSFEPIGSMIDFCWGQGLEWANDVFFSLTSKNHGWKLETHDLMAEKHKMFNKKSCVKCSDYQLSENR